MVRYGIYYDTTAAALASQHTVKRCVRLAKKGEIKPTHYIDRMGHIRRHTRIAFNIYLCT